MFGMSSFLDQAMSMVSEKNKANVLAVMIGAPRAALCSLMMSGGKFTARQAWEACEELSGLSVAQYAPFIKKQLAAKKKEDAHQKKLLKDWARTGYRAKRPKGLKTECFPIGGFGDMGDYLSTPSAPAPIQLPPPVVLSKKKKA